MGCVRGLFPRGSRSSMLALRMSDEPRVWDRFDDVLAPPPDPALPEIVFLAGFLGLHLARPSGERVWLTPGQFALGDVARALRFDSGAEPLWPDGLNHIVYRDMVTDLRRAGFAVHALNFDFRKSVLTIAEELRVALEALGPNRRFVFVSHSMGALVAAVYPHVDSAWQSRIERSIFLGGPLAGTFEVVDAGIGVHSIIRRLAILSLRNDAADYAACMRTWPALYDMLPDPAWFKGGDAAFEDSHWPAAMKPSSRLLEAARRTREKLVTSPLFGAVPCAQLLSLRFATADTYADGRIASAPGAAPGDGTVAARTATFGGIPAYRVDLPHTLIPLDPKAIRGVIELAKTGVTSLPGVTPSEVSGRARDGEPTLEDIMSSYAITELTRAPRDGLSLLHVCWLLGPGAWW
ncbi:Hypothetical protein A7982_10232 [Minicystis rosea]|nr:Hypothetical protein A7982_10232 [Minicystis rosea]